MRFFQEQYFWADGACPRLLTVRDLLPAGLEVLDDTAEGFLPQSLNLSWRGQHNLVGAVTSLHDGRCRKRVSGQSVEWICHSVPAGTHTFAVLAMANVPGFFAVSSAAAAVHVAAQLSPGDQVDYKNIPRTLLGTTGSAHNAFAVLPVKTRNGDATHSDDQGDPFKAAGLPQVRSFLGTANLITRIVVGEGFCFRGRSWQPGRAPGIFLSFLKGTVPCQARRSISGASLDAKFVPAGVSR